MPQHLAFPGPTARASLKPCMGGAAAGRGAIAFPGPTARASLKRPWRLRQAGAEAGAFPGPTARASLKRRLFRSYHAALASRLPGPNSPGLIEAGRCDRDQTSPIRQAFPGPTARASLKQVARAVASSGSSQNLPEILRFRNGPVGVKSLVSTSPISGAPRECAHRSAVASAVLAMHFRCRRRRFLASVRGQRKAATPCHQRRQRAYLKTRGQTERQPLA